jgi:RNA polymerase sigma-70 factor (ECF subfamily)
VGIGVMTHPGSFEELISRLAQRSQGAATEVFERFAERLIELARARLGPRLRQKMDPDDIVQSVFKSFFRRQGAGQFDFEGWGGLWGLLVTLTVRKCGRRAEEFYAARRDVRREVRPVGSLDGSMTPTDTPTNEPTPEEAAILTELVEQLMSSLDQRGREVLTLRLQGYSVAEIGDRIGRTQRTVQRTLEQIKARLERLSDNC